MKVKLIAVYEHYVENDDYNVVEYSLYGSTYTDWEEVTTEDCQILKDWVRDNNYRSAQKYTLLVDENIPVKPIISDYLERAKKEKAEQAERERKKQEKERKRLETIAKKKEEKEKALLEKLLIKHGKQS